MTVAMPAWLAQLMASSGGALPAASGGAGGLPQARDDFIEISKIGCLAVRNSGCRAHGTKLQVPNRAIQTSKSECAATSDTGTGSSRMVPCTVLVRCRQAAAPTSGSLHHPTRAPAALFLPVIRHPLPATTLRFQPATGARWSYQCITVRSIQSSNPHF